jgi:branched-subunit amino acid aminotransferase/4-amino-4-deoxychorismate lyase
MLGTWFWKDGELRRAEEAAARLDDADLTQGYGCYEVLKLRSGLAYFPEFHEERLFRSLSLLGIAHELKPGFLRAAIAALAEVNGLRDANIKVLVIGRADAPAECSVIYLPPIYPPADAPTLGVGCLLFMGQRQFPRAKSLSLLLSTVAFRAAATRSCYEALLVNAHRQITEGTRMNLFYAEAEASSGSAIYTPPADQVLEGITRRTIMMAMAAAGRPIQERPLSLDEALSGRYALMVSSTSNRALPVRSLLGPLDPEAQGLAAKLGAPFELPRSAAFDGLVSIYDEYLAAYAGAAP